MTFNPSSGCQHSYSKGQTLILTGFEAVINLFTAPKKTDAELIIYQNTYLRLRLNFSHTMNCRSVCHCDISKTAIAKKGVFIT